MTQPTADSQIPIACDLSVLTAQQREEHSANSEELFALVSGVEERADGYALRLPSEASVLMMAARFIQYERLCCPFFTFGIEVTAQNGPVWLSFSGGSGVKEFIASGIVSALDHPVSSRTEP